jgi:hypothetical protein
MTIPASLATAFLAYLALVAALIAAVLIRFLPARAVQDDRQFRVVSISRPIDR